MHKRTFVLNLVNKVKLWVDILLQVVLGQGNDLLN